MNVWGLLLTVLGWAILITLVIVFLLVISGLVTYMVRGIKPKQIEPPTDEEITEAGKQFSKKAYENSLFEGVQEGAFERGIKYALDAKGGRDANRI